MNKAVSLLLSNACNKDIEIQRLSKQFGQPFILNISPIDISSLNLIKDNNSKMYKALHLSIAGLDSITLFEFMKVASFDELLDALFTVGEIYHIYEEILDISILDSNDIEDLKKDTEYEDAYWLWKHKYITAPSEYFKMAFVDKQVLSVFISRQVEESNVELTEIVDAIKSSKSAESVQGQLLLKLIQMNLY